MGGSYGLPGTRWWGTVQQYTGLVGYPATIEPATNPSNIFVDEYCDDGSDVPANGTSVTADQVGAEAYNVWNAGHINLTAGGEIMVMLPPGVSINTQSTEVTSANGFHAFHTYIGDFIAVNFGAVTAGGAYAQTIQHEIAETDTDPLGGLQYSSSYCNNPPFTWVNSGNGECEIADLCFPNQFSVQVQPTTDPPYAYEPTSEIQQQLWSNEAGGCVYGRTETVFEFGFGTNAELYAQRITANAVSPAPTQNNWFEWGFWSSYPYVGKPGAVSWGPNRLDVFAIDSSNQMWHLYSNTGGANNGGEALSMYTADDVSKFGPDQYNPYAFDSTQAYTYPDAASVGAGNVQVFAFQREYGGTNTPRLVKDVWDGGTWSEWIPMSTPATASSQISAVGFGATNYRSQNGSFPTSSRTVMLSYVDTSARIWVGYTTDDTTPVWSSFTDSSFTAVDVDISSWSPERYDLFVRDTAGRFWDCSSNFTTTATPPIPVGCSNWSAPSGALSTFNATPGAIGLGDGRLFVVGRAQYNPGNGGAFYNSSFSALWNENSGTGWELSGGAFNGGIDLASW